MPMLVNTTPVEDAVVKALFSEHGSPEYVLDVITPDDLGPEGQRLLRSVLVEGEPADGLTLHGTLWGRRWCAFRTVE